MIRIAPVLLATLALSGAAFAQSAGTLRGSVVDNCGRVVEGAELRLRDQARGATSGASGRLRLARIERERHLLI